MKTICFICRCNCFFFSFVFVIDKQIDIFFCCAFGQLDCLYKKIHNAFALYINVLGVEGENITFNLT